jgi:hypothetical protein
MKQEKTNIDNFETKLGKVDLVLTSSENPRISKYDNTTLIETNEHLIEVIAFSDIQNWMQATNTIENSIG